ncbi:MAG: sigma-70 family RNA polymerase sigma factor [Pirellulaceae bacterium]
MDWPREDRPLGDQRADGQQRDDRLASEEVAALHDEHALGLRRFVLGVLRDPELTADVVQTTFGQLVRVGHLTQAESRKAWLYQVAYREALAAGRRRSKEKGTQPGQADGQVDGQTLDWLAAAAVDEGLAPLVQAERVAHVRAALDALAPELSEVVRLRIYQQRTFAQIAKQLDIPLGTALGRMQTALKKLREKLAKWDRDEHE